jgi:hypothetical protein
MGVLDKVKAAAGRATTKAQEGVATVQTKRKLTQAYGELGQTTYELVQSGELTHPRLSPTVERISTVKAQLEREERAERPPPGRHLNLRRSRPCSGTSASSRLRRKPGPLPHDVRVELTASRMEEVAAEQVDVEPARYVDQPGMRCRRAGSARSQSAPIDAATRSITRRVGGTTKRRDAAARPISAPAITSPG